MTNWKEKIDPETYALLKKAARCQLEMGISDMVVDFNGVTKKKEELNRSGRKNSPAHFRSIKSHKKAIESCLKCPLGETRTNFVYGVGNPKADVLFIGEAPGREEDLKGEPFIGRAGQLLDKILAAIKFKREDVYIANILKCRPPNNRDPQPDEMATCMPHLLEQIHIIKPKIICALGRISAQALLNRSTPLGKLRKQWHEYCGIPFIATYHPAALLRFQSYKKDVWEVRIFLRLSELPSNLK